AAQIGEQFDHRLVDEVDVRTLEARMPGTRHPVGDSLRELRGGHPGMRRGNHLEYPLLARRHAAGHVAGEDRLEGLARLPLRMLWSELLHTVEREGELEIDRLLGPEGAVVVEHSNAFRHRHELGAAV